MASNTILVNAKEYDPGTFSVENWTAGKGEIDYKFSNQPRPKPLVTEIIVHETVTCSALSTVAVLEPKNRNLGVHFVVDPSGLAYQHGDLALDELWHANQHNGVSFGIETVNPFTTSLMPKDGPWTNVIHAPWAGQKDSKYVVPTPEEAETVSNILAWAMAGVAPELQIPPNWVGLKNGKMALSPVHGADQLAPGIYAHHYFNHGDGSWLVLYSWLRLVGGLDAATAYQEAMKRASDVALGGGADVSDLVPVSQSGDEGPTG